MVAAICERGMPCIDLLEPLLRTPPADWDLGYDGTHYGPKTNRIIATLVQEQLLNRGVLK